MAKVIKQDGIRKIFILDDGSEIPFGEPTPNEEERFEAKKDVFSFGKKKKKKTKKREDVIIQDDTPDEAA